MNNKAIVFRMAARCGAAGRPNNEDNFLVDDNLANNQWGFTADTEISLGEKGALLVVCDGMGGMNAGEVASAIAVATIKEWFAADRLTDQVTANAQSIQKFLVQAIQAADAAIKKDAKDNPDHDGMGSTIVLAWLLGQKVYVGWCGDSRAYRYNPKSGLMRLSHDHSYVQELVDAGKLTEDLAFDHPNNNIITRSLGDPRGKAQPDTKEYDLCNEDIILLCSDGLCGCLRDNEIEDVIRNNQTSMQGLRDALWQADEAAGWHDNVTIVLSQIISGGAIVPVAAAATAEPSISSSKAELIMKNRRQKQIIWCLSLLILLVAGGLGGWYYFKHAGHKSTDPTPADNEAVVSDSDQSDAPKEVKAGEAAKTGKQGTDSKKKKEEKEEPAKKSAGEPSDDDNSKAGSAKLNINDLNNSHVDAHISGVVTEQAIEPVKAEEPEAPASKDKKTAKTEEKKTAEPAKSADDNKEAEKAVDPAEGKTAAEKQETENTAAEPADQESDKSKTDKSDIDKPKTGAEPKMQVVDSTATKVTIIKKD